MDSDRPAVRRVVDRSIAGLDGRLWTTFAEFKRFTPVTAVGERLVEHRRPGARPLHE
ncbi:hypothetical protein [Natronorarus salvus]|uniref:hypothetical protein n=1 Tax=Natronorarus salvus TaxID=3117733 RepID=UPI002F25EC93